MNSDLVRVWGTELASTLTEEQAASGEFPSGVPFARGDIEEPAPLLSGNAWQARPENPHTICFWENFDRDAIIADFFDSVEHYVLP